MDSYKIQWKNSAEKDIRSVDRRYIPQIVADIQSLCENPFPAGCRKLKGGATSFRIRVGDYRIIYQVWPDTKIILITYIRHRKDAYRNIEL